MDRSIQLRKMTAEEYESYLLYHIEHHSAGLVKDKGISMEEACLEVKARLPQMLPDGKDTQDNYLMVIERKEDSAIVGYMWYIYDRRRDTYLFLCDFHVFEGERRKGYGEAALYELDEAARKLLCKKCVLFVADANVNARKLYEKCGYIYRNERENGRYMDKDV